MSKILIASTTAAAISYFNVSAQNSIPPISLFVTGLAGIETADVKFSADNGVTYASLFEKGLQTQLSVINNHISINSPGIYAISKGITLGAVQISMSEALNA